MGELAEIDDNIINTYLEVEADHNTSIFAGLDVTSVYMLLSKKRDSLLGNGYITMDAVGKLE